MQTFKVLGLALFLSAVSLIPVALVKAEIDFSKTPITLIELADAENEIWGVASNSTGDVYFAQMGNPGAINKLAFKTLARTFLYNTGAVRESLTWANGKLYFINSYSSAQYASLVEGNAPVVLFSDSIFSWAAVVDRDNPQWLYYTTNAYSIKIWDGATFDTFISGICSGVQQPRGVVQETTGALAWVVYPGNDTDATGVIRRKLGTSSIEDIVTGIRAPRGLAIDTQNNLYYFHKYDLLLNLFRIEEMEAGKTTAYTTPKILIDGLFMMRRLATDSKNNLYWSEYKTSTATKALRVRTLPRLETFISTNPSSLAVEGDVTVTMLVSNHGIVTLKNISPGFNATADSGLQVQPVSGPSPAQISELEPEASAMFSWVYHLKPPDAQTGSILKAVFSGNAQASDVGAGSLQSGNLIFPTSSQTVSVHPSLQPVIPWLFALDNNALALLPGSTAYTQRLQNNSRAWAINPASGFEITRNTLSVSAYVSRIYSRNYIYPKLDIQLQAGATLLNQSCDFDANSPAGYYRVSFSHPALTLNPNDLMQLTLKESNDCAVDVQFGQGSSSNAGVYISGVAATPAPVVTPTPTPAPTSAAIPAEAALVLGRNAFSPGKSEALSLRVDLAEESSVRLAVYNAYGNRVRVLWEGTLTAGVWDNFAWDGKGMDGQNAGAGIYLIQIQTNRTKISRKVIVIK
jgi:hypothetical protein